MIQIGSFNKLIVTDIKDGMVILDNKIALPKKDLIKTANTGDQLEVFVYSDEHQQPAATTIHPKAMVGDLATLKVLEITPAGAWLDWGLPVRLFMPRSFHEEDLETGEYCLVKVLFDEKTNKILGKEKLDDEISNDTLTVKEMEVVDLIVYKDTPLGYQVIVNGKHLGLLHYNEVFKEYFVGDTFKGFVKKIKEDHKLDIMIGKPGFTRIEDVTEPILKLLKENGGFLPFHDKSPAEAIYKTFGLSKKTFKMTIGRLYKERKLLIEAEGIRLNTKN